MESPVNYFFRKVSPLYMNRGSVYDKTYYHNNHLKRVNSRYSFFVKLYYRYVASYCMSAAAKLPKNSKVLDIGCGVGMLAGQFKKLGFNITGVDVNKEAIANSTCPDNCFWVKTTARLDYPDNNFDLVVSREVLEHISESEIDECIKEWDRVGKGVMVHIIAVSERGPSAIDDPAHINVKSEQWWINKFKEHGYRAIKNPRKFFFSPFGGSGYFMVIKN